MNNGWIKLHRDMLQWEWYDDHNTKILFLHLLLKASHISKKWRGITIQPGELRTTRVDLVKETGLSEQQVRTSLDKLKSTHEITSKSTNKNTVISINNWNNHQQDNQQTTTRATNEQPTDNQPTSYLKNVKNVKNVKNTTTELKKFLSLFNSYFNSEYRETKGREVKIALRLKTYTFEQLEKALKTLASSDWHKGKNDRGWKADPEFLLRSDEQVDKWLNTKPEKEVKLVEKYTPLDQIDDEERKMLNEMYKKIGR